MPITITQLQAKLSSPKEEAKQLEAFKQEMKELPIRLLSEFAMPSRVEKFAQAIADSFSQQLKDCLSQLEKGNRMFLAIESNEDYSRRYIPARSLQPPPKVTVTFNYPPVLVIIIVDGK